jgi:hypothetical protein
MEIVIFKRGVHQNHYNFVVSMYAETKLSKILQRSHHYLPITKLFENLKQFVSINLSRFLQTTRDKRREID